MPNAYVFAGGAVDPGDSTPEMYALCRGMDDRAASAALRLPTGGLSFYVAAIRESFEECGLMATDVDEALDSAAAQTLISAGRSRLGAREVGFASLCRDNAWELSVERLSYFAHWVTPPTLTRRFDTRFFLALAPSRQIASLGTREMSQLIWRTAADALADHAAERILLMNAQRCILKEIAGFTDVEALLEYARTPRLIATMPQSGPRR